ncbi:MAG: ribonuclease HII [Chitinophagia bacterium]|nr:ribonuclease HII [Chitinophagia bacterium]
MLRLRFTDNLLEAGTDEAGRGCLAGPVVAAAVILPDNFSHEVLRDSKKLNPSQRNELAEIIKDQAVCYAVAHISPQRIDEINILNASIEAMHKSIAKLNTQPEYILVDGNRFKPYKEIPHRCIIKGDDKYFSIAAASVLAKVDRDNYMQQQAEIYPSYHWSSNMGYPTKAHREAIRSHGISPLHRLTFRLLPDAEQLDLFDK